MGTFLIIPLVGALVLATAAPVAAAPNTSNLSGSGRTIEGEWYGDSGYGSVSCSTSRTARTANLEESGLYAECAAGPDGEVYGFQGTRIQGWANGLTINVDAKLNAGSAAGDFEIAIETVDECAGTYDLEFDTVSVMVDVTGTGSVAMFRNSGSPKIPASTTRTLAIAGRSARPMEPSTSAPLVPATSTGPPWPRIAGASTPTVETTRTGDAQLRSSGRG